MASETLTSSNEEELPFSWLNPHPLFVILMVGPEETPFGIQKAFLTAKSTYFRNYFRELQAEQLETIVRLPETPSDVFGLAQNFMYTGNIFTGFNDLPGYEVLIATWKLGNKLGIDGLCDKALEAMTEVRQKTQRIPATPLLVQVWEDTPEGSDIRKLLLTWAAEYIRSSESRSEFSKSLPQEVLSELVVIMSHLDSAPANHKHQDNANEGNRQKNAHHLDDDHEHDRKTKAAKQRYSDAGPGRTSQSDSKANVGRKPISRASLPATKPPKPKRASTQIPSDFEPTTDQKLAFCGDLLSRMLSGPGFWTRLVGPFKEPVDPVTEGIPDYLEKITKPMDLGTIQGKMARREYNNEQEFEADVRQIFDNCFTYWTKKDPIYETCEKFKKTFDERYANMTKWCAKLDGNEMV